MLFTPWIENDLLPRLVWMQRRDDAAGRVVEQDRAHANLAAEPEVVGIVEKRFVLPDRFALVVEDRPAGADPARVGDRTAIDERSRLGGNLVLNLAAEPVGITEADAKPGLFTRQQIADVRFARNRRAERRQRRIRRAPCRRIAREVVDDPGRGALEQLGCERPLRVGMELINL